jgi:acetylornithine deacetylase/succinyl-diaminopimelate desuccinylase-like protein
MSTPATRLSLHEEVIAVARDLIRCDTTNAREPGLGNETLCAEYLQDYLTRNGVEAELVARDPRRANVVARIPGVASTGSTDAAAESLAFVGHTDVVPCDPRDWTHPPFEGVIDDDGYLWGRGAVDMKNEVAARAVAMAELARSGFRPRGDLWFIAVADEEDGFADVGMRWLLEERTDVRPTPRVIVGGGARIPLSDGR